MDLSGLDLSALDLSAIDPGAFSMPGLDLSALGNTDLSSAIDPSAIAPADLDLAGLAARYPELGEIDWASIVSKALSEGAIPPTAGQALAGTSAEIIQGFLDYYAAHSDTDGDGAPDADPLGLATAYISSPEVRARLEEALDSGEVVNTEVLSAKLATALGEDRALREVASRASAELAESIGRSLATQLATALSSQISQMISDSLSQTMAKAMSQMMTQIQNAIALQMERAMGGFASSLASAFTVDESAFAQAFRTNTDPEDLQRLLSTMMSTTPTTYDTNLTKLGWADPGAPSQINIYPTTFADKDAVKAIIEGYNEAATAAGDEARVVAYTDMVGLLMSSVTRIIDIIKWMLIAFVSISLVVSSIMIAIITLISVLERKKEIGILRSIGASKKDISRVFNAETFIVGLLAGLIGVGITLVLTLIANVIVEAKLEVADIAQLPVSAGAILIAVSIILTLIAGLLPARKAAKEDPVEALRSE